MVIEVGEVPVEFVQQPTDTAVPATTNESAWQAWWRGRFGRQLPFEILIVVAVYQGYKWARLLTRDHYVPAFANAERVAGWERRVGLLIEDDLQRFALGHPDLIWFLNRYYSYVHFTTTVAFLIWLYVRHGSVYGRIRRVMLATTVVSLAVHVLFPLAPPRMFPSMGFVDTISRFGPQIYDDDRVAALVNQIAAMPSLHFAWAVIIAWAVVRCLRHRLRWLVVLHPVTTLAAVVLTANHWWLDAAVAAAIVVGVAWVDSLVLPRSGIRSEQDPSPWGWLDWYATAGTRWLADIGATVRRSVRALLAPKSSASRAALEVGTIALFYFAYSAVRNGFGSAAVDPDVALRNAQWLIDAERSLGLFFEPALQQLVIDNTPLIWMLNVFYGTFHFIVTAAVLAWMFFRHPTGYRRARNTLAATTGLAIVGFSLFPVMPPRLLADCGPLGGCADPHLVDTIAEVGGLWSFDSGVVASMSNQYAAVPSLHIAWALWCAIALYPRLRHPLLRAIAVLYPIVTFLTTLITANHYWLDAALGALALGIGALIAAAIEGGRRRRSSDLMSTNELMSPDELMSPNGRGVGWSRWGAGQARRNEPRSHPAEQRAADRVGRPVGAECSTSDEGQRDW